MKNMRSVIISCALALALAAPVGFAAFAAPARAAAPALIRIGLEQNFKGAARIPLDNSQIEIGFSNPGNFTPEATLTAKTGFAVAPADAWFISSGAAYPTYGDALAAVLPGFFPAYTQNGWTLYGGPFATPQDAAAAKAGGKIAGPAGCRVALYDGEGIAAVFDNPGAPVLINGPQTHYISLGGRTYRGVVEFSRVSGGGGITPVNIIPLEQYLYSVVPSEMPKDWPAEALKAQAVAARTYTAYMAAGGRHSAGGYDLCDAVHCQSYTGFAGENPATNRAVDETAGVMTYYNNQPIQAVYFGSDGGATQNSEDVWTQALPYLRSVPDTYQTEYKTWTRSFTLDDIQNCLARAGYDIGGATGVSVGSLSPAGYVASLVISGTAGSQTLTGSEIRAFFSPTDLGSLPSACFTIGPSAAPGQSAPLYVCGASGAAGSAPSDFSVMGADSVAGGVAAVYVMGADSVADYPLINPPAAGVITFSGKGAGHGAGMSQYGAKGMAQAGFGYRQILEYYYTGVDVR